MANISIDNVPFIALNRFESGFKARFLEGVKELVDNTQFVGGSQVSSLEKTLASKSQAKYVIGCANGTDAIQVALRTVGVGQGQKVLIPDMTFWATFEAVINAGAEPITVDVNRESCHWDIATFQEAVDKFKPEAAVLVHLYGWACPDTEAIRNYAKKKGVLLVEDCAQCFGTLYDQRSVFENALIATTSFYPAKVLGASGDAGAIFTNDEKLAGTARALCNHGRIDHYSHGLVGWNSRIGSYESLFLNLSLAHLESRLESRRAAIQYYQEHLEGLPITVVTSVDRVQENGYCAVSMLPPDLRGNLIDTLKNASIGFGTIYPGAMSRQPGASTYLKNKIDLNNADYISNSVLNLPCFAYITESELDYVVRTIKKHFEN